RREDPVPVVEIVEAGEERLESGELVARPRAGTGSTRRGRAALRCEVDVARCDAVVVPVPRARQPLQEVRVVEDVPGGALQIEGGAQVLGGLAKLLLRDHGVSERPE